MTINFHDLGEESTTGASATFQEPGLALAGLFVNITAISGLLAQIVVRLQQSPNGTDWYNVGTISVTQTGTGTYSSSPAALALVADYTRVTWTITGTNPSVTFSADVVAQKVR